MSNFAMKRRKKQMFSRGTVDNQSSVTNHNKTLGRYHVEGAEFVISTLDNKVQRQS